MGRSKNFFSLYNTNISKTVSSAPLSTLCGTEKTDSDLYVITATLAPLLCSTVKREPNSQQVMSQTGCLCDQNSYMQNSLKDFNRFHESTGVETGPANRCLLDASSQTASGAGRGKALVSLLPSSLHLSTPLDDQSKDCRVPDPYRSGDCKTKHQLGKRPYENKQGYNIRPRNCTCMGSQGKVYPWKENTLIDLSEEAALMTKSSTTHNLQKEKDPEHLGIDSQVTVLKQSRSSTLAPKQASMELPEENYPAVHMTQEAFLKNCGLVKMHSVVYVKQEIEPMELDLECQIVGVEVPLPAPPSTSPNSRSLISSIKRESCESSKARKCLSLDGNNSEDSDYSSDSGIGDNSVGRPQTCGSLLCVDISSPLGQRVKKFTKADFVKPPLTDIEQYCVGIPEEDEVRSRLRHRETYPVQVRRRVKGRLSGYCHIYKFSHAERRRYIRNVFKPKVNTMSQEQQQQMNRCWVHLNKLDVKKMRCKILKNKPVLNQELAIDNDVSIVRLDVAEQPFDKMQKISSAESSSQQDQESQLVDVESVVPVPEHSAAALRTSSTGIREGVPRHLRPCPKSKRKQQVSLVGHAEEMVIDSVSLSSEEDIPVERQRGDHEEFQLESEEVQIVSVSGPKHISSEMPPSVREGLVGATDSRMATSSDVIISSSPVEVSQNGIVQSEPAVCNATNRHLHPVGHSVIITTSSVSFQNSICSSSSPTCPAPLTTTVGACSICSVHPILSVPSSAENVFTVNNSPLVLQSAGTISGGAAEPGVMAQNPVQSIPVTQSAEVQTGLGLQQNSHLVHVSSHINVSDQQTGVQTPADLQSYPVIQSVYSLQAPPVEQKTPDGEQTVMVLQGSPAVPSNMNPQMCPGIPDSPVGSSVPVIPNSSVQRVPVAFLSPCPNAMHSPQTNAVHGATDTYGNASASVQNLHPVHSSLPETVPHPVTITPEGQNAPFLVNTCSRQNFTEQGTMCGTSTTCVQNHTALPNLFPVVNEPNAHVIPVAQTVIPSVHMTHQVQNTASVTDAATQHITPNVQNTSDTANIQTIPAAASTQIAPQVMCSTNWQNSLHVQNTPLVPNTAGAQNTCVVQNSPHTAQPASIPSIMPAVRASHYQHAASMLALSQSENATHSQVLSTANLLHTQNTGPIPDVASVGNPAQISYVQNSTSMASTGQRHHTPHGYTALPTSVSLASPYMQGTIQTSVSQNTPIQTSVSQNMPNVQGTIQTSISQSTPYIQPGTVKMSVSQNPPPYVQDTIQTSVSQNTLSVQSTVQTSVSQNTPYVQSTIQTSVSQNTPYVQGTVQTSISQNTPYVQGTVQTSVSQNTPYIQGIVQTSVPQNATYAQDTVQTSVSQNTPYVQGTIPRSVSHNTPYVQGTVQTSIAQNTPYLQGTVQTSVSQNSSFFQGTVQMSVSESTQNTRTMQTAACTQTTPQRLSQPPSTTSGHTTPFQNIGGPQSAPVHSDPHQTLSSLQTTSYAQNNLHLNPPVTGNASVMQHNSHSNASMQVSSYLPNTCISSVSCYGAQSSAHLQAAPVQSSVSVQSTSSDRAGQQLQQTSCSLNQAGTVGDEDSPEELRKKLSVFNLIPNRFPVMTPSKQLPEKAKETNQNMSCAQSSEGSNSELRISAVYGAAELASMFPNSFSGSSSSGRPPERTHNVPCAQENEGNSPQLCIGAVYGAAELANSQLAASLGLACPRSSRSVGQGAPVLPSHPQTSLTPQNSHASVGLGVHVLSSHRQNSHNPQAPYVHGHQGSTILPTPQQTSQNVQATQHHLYEGSSVIPSHQQTSHNPPTPGVMPLHQQSSYQPQNPHTIPTHQQTPHNPQTPGVIPTHQQTPHNPQTPGVVPTHQQTPHNPPTPSVITTHQQTPYNPRTPGVIPTHQQAAHNPRPPGVIPTHQQAPHNPRTPSVMSSYQQTSPNPPTPQVISTYQQTSHNPPTPHVIPPHQQASYNPHTQHGIPTQQQTSHNPDFRTMQPCYDLTVQAAQQNPVRPNAHRFTHPQPFTLLPGQTVTSQQHSTGRSRGSQPGQRGQGIPAASSVPPRIPATQHGLSSGVDDDDCVEVIYLDDD